MVNTMANEPEEKYVDPVIEYYKQFVDRTLLYENLKLTPEQRIMNIQRAGEALEQLQQAMRDAKRKQ